MTISDEKIKRIKEDYTKFKKTSSYSDRENQLDFVDFARSILTKLLQRESLTNEDLTALIQMFGYGSKKENFEKYLKSLNFEEAYTEDILTKFSNLGQTGFTGRGKATIQNRTANQLSIIRKFLFDVSQSDSEKSIKKLILKFDKNNIPQVKYGVYSPWLYYLHPTICPIVAGPVNEYLINLGLDEKNYLSAWDMLKQLNQAIGEKNYGFLDGLIWYKNINSTNYWLFIVPKDYYEGELWKYCKENSIAAMQYQKGSESDKAVTTNLNQIKKIKSEDKVIVYLNDNIIGGIGEVSEEFYNNTSDENGFDGLFGQRIGLEWLTNNFEMDFKPMKPFLTKSFPKHLGLKTIHDIDKNDFNKILKFVDEGIIDNGISPNISIKKVLLNKQQIIFYGPPGTGKTYKAREIAVDFIEGVL